MGIGRKHRERRKTMAAFVGKYKFDRNENLDDYIKKMDLPFMAKTAMKKAKPDVTIAQEEGGKRWKMKFVSLMTQEISFELGKEFMNKIPVVNKEIKAIATLEENGTKLKFVSHTDMGEEIRTYALSADGKEMI